MSRFLYVVRSLFFFWRVNLAVCLGVIAATAVLTGALLVGDSMRGSLRKISLDGLGGIDEILLTDRFFREDLAKDIRADENFQSQFGKAEAIILFPNASATYKKSESESSLANKITLIGCRNEFWEFSSIDEASIQGSLPDFNQMDNAELESGTVVDEPIPIVLNEPLAKDLGINASDLKSKENRPILTVQIPKPQLINADNPIGKKEDLYQTIARLRVTAIIPAESVGRFTLHPSQLVPRILFLPISHVQDELQQYEMANALVVSLSKGKGITGSNTGTTPAQSDILNAAIHPTVRDLGFIFKQVEQTYRKDGTTNSVFQYTSLSSDQLLLTDNAVETAMNSLNEFQPQKVLTYLATGMELEDSASEEIPFSMVSAIDFDKRIQLDSALNDNKIKPLADNEIAINSWVAEDLLKTSGVDTDSLTPKKLKLEFAKLVGKQMTLKFFEPEASHGKLIPRSETFKIVDIAKVVNPKTPFNRRRPAVFELPPTQANDPDLTPFVPGVTDQNSINKWDLPFKTKSRSQDDTYWKFFRTTPKAFVNLATGQRLWKSRFGKVTSIRVYAGDKEVAELEDTFLQTAKQDLASLGFKFIPIKRRNLEASSGSTPFDVLFLALSFFIIAAALILISLLFRLGVDQKVEQLGLLSSVGVNRSIVSRLLIFEGVLIAVIGAAIGIFIGVLYAKLMVYGLTTWWVGAVVTSFMEYHWTVRSLGIGLVTGVLVSVMTIWISVRRLGDLSVRNMLTGKTEVATAGKTAQAKILPLVAWISFVLAIVLSVIAATTLGGEAQAGAFMGGGFLMLFAFLIWIWLKFKKPSPGFRQMSGQYLAVQNASRNPLRSTLTIGLVAAATFLIVSVSSFHLTPTEKGTGGFEYLAESSRPIVGDLRDDKIQQDLLGDSVEALNSLEVYSIRFQPGDEAGCNNPFQAQRPQVLGLTDSLIESFERSDESIPGFAWAGSTATTESEKKNPWRLLQAETDDGTVPVVIDKNTAMYSLKIFSVGGTYEVEFDGGQVVTFRVAGFLSNSTLQGSLIISESHFEKLFPNVTGYRKYLINVADKSGESIGSTQVKAQLDRLETELANYGFDASDSKAVLASFLAVQNTYLSTFQTLGAFGLLLGTFGLATVQMRNVVERRKELALLRAIGFSRSKLGQIVLSEHSSLLLAGMFVGTISALFAVVPHILFGDANVPIVLLSLVLLSILLVGLVSGFGAVISSAKTPILSALRSDD